MTIAMISDLFFGEQAEQHLRDRLMESRDAGAELAVLAELALDPWFPARPQFRHEDGESPLGRRSRLLAESAKAVGIGIVGGAVLQDPAVTQRRRSTALVYDKLGRLLGEYAKCHLPDEPGYWEARHYQPGDYPAAVFRQFPVPFGVQICSDANRPAGSQALAALGAELILVPRATEAATFPRWRLVFQANAITSCAYVASVTRPRPEAGVAMGGPSILVGPTGEVLLESTDPVAIATIDRAAVLNARAVYPGSLAVRADLYARAWANIAPQGEAARD